MTGLDIFTFAVMLTAAHRSQSHHQHVHLDEFSAVMPPPLKCSMIG